MNPLTPLTRTSHQKPFAHASIQTKKWKALATVDNLKAEADRILSEAQYEAYQQGIKDAESSTRDHPPYGFSDLKQAWQMGWLKGTQEKRK